MLGEHHESDEWHEPRERSAETCSTALRPPREVTYDADGADERHDDEDRRRDQCCHRRIPLPLHAVHENATKDIPQWMHSRDSNQNIAGGMNSPPVSQRRSASAFAT